MISLIVLYVLFLSGGLIVLRKQKLKMKEQIIFIGVTTFGGILWGSIILRHQIDLNKFIALICNKLQ